MMIVLSKSKIKYDYFVKNMILMIFKKHMVISLKIIIFSKYDFVYFSPVIEARMRYEQHICTIFSLLTAVFSKRINVKHISDWYLRCKWAPYTGNISAGGLQEEVKFEYCLLLF